MRNKLILLLLSLLILIQFVPAPPKTNPPADPSREFAAVMKPPPEVHAILKRACYDCHSNQTVWPWYADIAPISWPVRNHVADGRKHLNFSEWLKPGETTFSNWSDLEDIGKALLEQSMPLRGYDWMHPEAKLTAAERQVVASWADGAIGGPR